MRLLVPTLSLAFMLAASCTSTAQNSPPSLGDVTTTTIDFGTSVEVTYGVSDPEQDPITVHLAVTGDSGRTYARPHGSVTGAIGSVQPGVQRLTWTLDDIDRARFGNRDIRVRIVADDGRPVDVVSILAQVDSVSLRARVEELEGPRNRAANTAHFEAVRTSIASIFDENGFTARRQRFIFATEEGVNIIGERGGLVDGDSAVVLDAHYDTVTGAPGADDNGSGVAGMLEAISALKDVLFRKTIRAIGFDMEEDGLRGSHHYVTSLRGADTNITGVFNFEMIGYATDAENTQAIPPGFSQLFPAATDSINANGRRGNFLSVVANTASTSLADALESAARRYVPELRTIRLTVGGTGQSVSDLRRSDHARFWDGGYPALMLTDGANFRNPNYHKPSDTAGTLNYTFMERVTRATLGAIIDMAEPMHASARESEPFLLAIPSTAPGEAVNSFQLEQNAPNPFTSTTTIGFTLPRSADAMLEIVDATGRRVARPVDGRLDAGRHTVDLEARGITLAPGLYIYRLVVDGESLERTMVVK